MIGKKQPASTGNQRSARGKEGRLSLDEALRASEEKLSAIFDKASFAIALARLPDGVVVDVNEAWVAMYGYTRREAIGKTSAQLGINRSSDKRARLFAEIERRGSIRDRELYFFTKSGARRHIAINVDLVELLGQKYMLSTMQDITERKLAEKERKQLVVRLRDVAAKANRDRAQFEAVFQAIRDAVFVLDMQGNTIHASQGEITVEGASGTQEPSVAAMMSDYEVSELDGQLLTPAEWPVSRVLRGESFRDVEFHCRRKDSGQEWIFSFSGTPVRNEHGMQVLAVLVTRDITDRKRAEHALRQSEQRLEMALHSARMVAFVWDPIADQMDFSGDFAAIYGRPPFTRAEDGFGLIHPDDRARHRATVEKAVREGGAYVIEFRIVRPDNGAVVWIEDRSNVILDDTGRVKLVAGTAVDISQRKQMEQARDTDRRKTEFLAVLSHELRNPLASIKNSVYVLDHASPGGDQARRAQGIIGRQVDQLHRLVDDLMDVTRITRARIQLKMERLELNELLGRVVEDHRSIFDKREVELALSPATLPLFVNADPNRLAQIVGNLLQNAAKFTDHGGSTIVSLAADSESSVAVIRVVDTGVGIDPQMLPRLFEPFTQADSSLDRTQGGLGLGLALVKGLIELHGGDVTVQSGIGEGTEFVVRLPLASIEVAASPPSSPRRTRKRRRVLIIEDNVEAAASLREVLEFGNHHVEIACDGLEGLEKARTVRPEFVLCDIGLPGMNGYDVARAFRADQELNGMYLVALSGYAQPEDVRRASEARFDQHLAKPVSFERLEGILQGPRSEAVAKPLRRKRSAAGTTNARDATSGGPPRTAAR
jgi:PAS domain S-box-containing protein